VVCKIYKREYTSACSYPALALNHCGQATTLGA